MWQYSSCVHSKPTVDVQGVHKAPVCFLEIYIGYILTKRIHSTVLEHPQFPCTA